MAIGTESLSLLLVLLPGFLCAKIVQWLCVRPEQTEMDKIVEAFIYSFLVYLAFTSFVGKLEVKSTHLLALGGISCVLAFVISLIWTNDTFGDLLRRLRITHRTSRPSVWNDTFHHYGGYALVELADGRYVAGWIKFYSDVPTATSLFLEDAAWVSINGDQHPVAGPGVLIAPACGIKTVSFHAAKDTRKVVAKGATRSD